MYVWDAFPYVNPETSEFAYCDAHYDLSVRVTNLVKYHVSTCIGVSTSSNYTCLYHIDNFLCVDVKSLVVNLQ